MNCLYILLSLCILIRILHIQLYFLSDFLTEKGLLAVAKLLNADNLFQTVVNLDMKTVQIDQICEKVPTSSKQAFTLLKTALDQHKNNKIDKLLSALESAGEGGLAENIRKLFKDQHDLSQVYK